MSLALKIDGCVVKAGATTILDGVAVEVERGAVIAIVGANGAGKTTLLDVISGVVSEMAGTVTIGDDVCVPGARRARVGRVFQGSPLPETLTVGEVVSLVARDRATNERVLDRFGLTPHATSFVAELSTGMRRIVDLAIATVGSPDVLLLDEPASGLAQSEIDHLAGVVRSVTEETGCAVILVEHDASLVHQLADEVVVLEAGKVVARGSVEDVLAASHARARPRIQTPHDDRFHDALARVEATASPAAALPKRSLSKWTLMRLGLREMAAGMASVVIIGVLTRALHVEKGISLLVVTAIVATYNLAAPLAIGIGHRSDTHPIFGRRRTPYIIIGAIVMGLAVIAAPHVASGLQHVTFFSVIFSVLLFVAMGVGMSGSGSVFLALLADLSDPRERGHVASVVYMELMVGILAGVALTAGTLEDGTEQLGTLFAIVGVLVIVLTTIAVWGHEPKNEQPQHVEEPVRLRVAIREIAALPQARKFFIFVSTAMFFLFLQNSILSSFGGDVLHLSLRATGNFQGMLTIGTITGMVLAGRPFADQLGHHKVSMIGLVVAVIGFAGLAGGAAAGSAAPVWLSILVLGLGSGVFTVSTLALMMGMSDRKRTALFMGAWTVARAFADGGANAGGGALVVMWHHILHSLPGGYATVFAIEAVGLALCAPLLRGIKPGALATPETDGSAHAIAAMAALEPVMAIEASETGESPASTNGAGSVARATPLKARATTSKARASGAKKKTSARPKR